MALDNDGARNGEPLSCALPDLLGGEERIEDTFSVFRLDATTVVRDGDFDVLIALRRRNGDRALVYAFAGSLDGMRGVNDEVEKYLIQLADIAHHLWQLAELRDDLSEIL